MAKATGVGISTYSIDDAAGTPRDLRAVIGAFGISMPRAVQDVTGLSQAGMDRLPLLADVAIDTDVFLDTAANSSHDVFKTVLSASNSRTTSIGFASVTFAPEMLYTDYNITRDSGAAVTIKCPGVLTGGAVPAWA